MIISPGKLSPPDSVTSADPVLWMVYRDRGSAANAPVILSAVSICHVWSPSTHTGAEMVRAPLPVDDIPPDARCNVALASSGTTLNAPDELK